MSRSYSQNYPLGLLSTAKIAIVLVRKITQFKKLMDTTLESHQKYNLHLLLRASLKDSNPIEAMERRGIDPALFTDIFLRADLNRQISYSELEQLSYLCFLVIHWRESQLPKVDLNQTYAGRMKLLLHDLSENTSSLWS